MGFLEVSSRNVTQWEAHKMYSLASVKHAGHFANVCKKQMATCARWLVFSQFHSVPEDCSFLFTGGSFFFFYC